jgi:glycosyltransferase involved in cell wall biosynthesis
MEKRPLKVLEIMGNAIVGGMETFVLRMIQRLPPNIQVSVICPQQSRLTEEVRKAGCKMHVTPVPEDPAWNSIRMAVNLVKSEGIDVIHTHLANAHLLGGITAKLCDLPLLAHVHGHEVWISDLEMHRIADTHLAVSSRATWLQALGAGVRRDHLHHLPNGVDAEDFVPRPRDAAVRASWGVPADAPLVGFVGRLSPEKGPEVFMRAAAIAAQSKPAAHFVYLGDGPMLPRLEVMALQAQLGERVHFCGVQPDMRKVYPELDVMALTSYTESMPLAVLEAMACEVPVVATEVGAVLDQVIAKVTGLLTAVGHYEGTAVAVLGLLDDPERARRMGRAARERVQAEFNLQKSVDGLADLLGAVAGGERKMTRLSTVKSTGVKSSGLSKSMR